MAGVLSNDDVAAYRWVLNKYGSGRHGMTEGDPVAIPPVLPSFFHPDLQDEDYQEMLNLIVALGGTPSRETLNQAATLLMAQFDDVRKRARFADWNYAYVSPLAGGAPVDLCATRGQAFALMTTKLIRVNRGGTITDTGYTAASPQWGGAARDGCMYQIYATASNDSVAGTDKFDTISPGSSFHTTSNFATNDDLTRVYYVQTPLGGIGTMKYHSGDLADIDTGELTLGASGDIGSSIPVKAFATNGRVVASKDTATMWRADDGSGSWTTNAHSTIAAYSDYCASIKTASGAVLCRASASGFAYSSDWGATWSTVSLPAGFTISDLKSDGIDFYAAGTDSGKSIVYVSRDGATWSSRPLPVWIGTSPKIACEIFDPTGIRAVRLWAIGSANLVAVGRSS
jgi:hypothetical protein